MQLQKIALPLVSLIFLIPAVLTPSGARTTGPEPHERDASPAVYIQDFPSGASYIQDISPAEALGANAPSAAAGLLLIDGARSAFLPVQFTSGGMIVPVGVLGALGCVPVRAEETDGFIIPGGLFFAPGADPRVIFFEGERYIGADTLHELTGVSCAVNAAVFTVAVDTVSVPPDAALRTLAEAAALPCFSGEDALRLYAFIQAHPELSAERAAACVAIGLDRPFYTGVSVIEQPDDVLVLCNKYNQLDAKYAPRNLTDIGGGMQMRRDAGTAFTAMREAMRREGLRITVRSAYRSYTYQNNLYNNYVANYSRQSADTYSARAGFSEHQTGLAVDFLQYEYGGSGLEAAHFEDTPQYQWLLENAHSYGFILRYPKGEEWITGYKFEPWHWRYVGEETAADFKERGIATFDEYCAMIPSDESAAP